MIPAAAQRSSRARAFFGKAGKVAGPLFGASMIVEPMLTTEGGPDKRLMSGVKGMTEMAGFDIATSFAGKGVAKVASTGAGKFALGKHAAKVARWGRFPKGSGALMVAGMAIEGAYEFQKHLADIGSRQRLSGLEWGKGSAGMNTRRAHTMRQQSLQEMNRGSMSARSLLGREAQYLHQ